MITGHFQPPIFMKFKSTGVGLLFLAGFAAQTVAAPAPNDLSEYKTPATAITTQITKGAAITSEGQAGYLGVSVAADKKGALTITHLAPDSPADRAGLKIGDLLV